MKQALLILFVFLISILGCVQPLIDNGYHEYPLLPPDVFDVYGEIVDYTGGEYSIVEMQAEIVNGEINNTYLELNITESAINRMWKRIYDINELVTGEDYNFKIRRYGNFSYDENLGDHMDFWYYGTLINYDQDGRILYVSGVSQHSSSVEPFGAHNVTFYNSTLLEEENDEFLYANRPYRLSDFVKGEKYALNLMRSDIDENYTRYIGPWTVISMYNNLTEFRQSCSEYHNRDLQIGIEDFNWNDRHAAVINGQNVFSNAPMTIITPGESMDINILMMNTQDNEITYQIKDARILNEYAAHPGGYWWSYPPYEERVEDATIDGCNVTFDSSEKTIPAYSNTTLSFTVFCTEGTDITKEYIECDSYEERRNCEIIDTGDDTFLDFLMLWGDIEFTDELGNAHKFPQPDGTGALKQGILYNGTQ